MSFPPIKDGEFTSTIYGMIKEGKFNEAIRVLQYESQRSPTNRAALSLLGYCYYFTGDFMNASDCYEQLSQLYTTHPQYKLYYAQSLFNANYTHDALSAVAAIEETQLLGEVVKMEAAIKYREGDLNNARILVQQFPNEDPDIEVNLACIDYKEGSYDQALQRFTNATSHKGFTSELAYSIALCHYQKKDYQKALHYITDIIDRGVKEHPELAVGMGSENSRSVGNTMALQESALVEAFNLKFAIDYKMGNMSSASEALQDMPPRAEEELDHVTLHNHALLVMDVDPSDGFGKLQYLMSQSTYPDETFSNLLILYCHHEYYELAADLLAENAHLTYKLLTPYLYQYLDALINLPTSEDDAYAKLDSLINEQVKELRTLTKKIQELAATEPESPKTKDAMKAFDDKLQLFLPVLMSQAKIFWDNGNYSQVEKVFKNSYEFCSEHETWRLNVAHTIFMQGKKLKEAAAFYEPILTKNFDNVLDVSAIHLANLCVCYILTNQNEAAEQLISKVEREEEMARALDENRKFYHVCIINLVIGTLYCSKGNFDFGISRVVQAMMPIERKLGSETWINAKRAIMAMIEAISKHLVQVRDAVIDDVFKLLEGCEAYGRHITPHVDRPLLGRQIDTVKNTVTYEARLIRALLLHVLD